WAVDLAKSYQTSVFMVEIGDPSSWRRLTPVIDWGFFSQFAWTPDDQYIIHGPYRINAITGEMETPVIHGFSLANASLTRFPDGYYILTDTNSTNIAALPVLSDGSEDPERSPVVITNFSFEPGVFLQMVNSVDGDRAVFAVYRAGEEPNASDVYVLRNLPEILAAPMIEGTAISTLAPTSLSDANFIPIRADETANAALFPYFSEDGTAVIYSEDWNHVFRYDWDGLFQSDFDLMISSADGTGSDERLGEPGNQLCAAPSGAGTRIIYSQRQGTVFHLTISTLEVISEVQGIPVAGNAVVTTTEQQASDMSGTVVLLPAATTVDFPTGVPQEIHISTPIQPAQVPQLPPGIGAIPVVRDFGPAGTTFDPAITITISYTDAEVEGIDEGSLRPFRYNEGTGVYDIEVITITERNLVNNTISFAVDHFSTYGLGDPADTDGDGICNDLDPDDDNDGMIDAMDEMPLDTDNDGMNNDIDNDDDSDGILDLDDPLPQDTDNDGERNDVDADDDNDGLLDADELIYGTNPLLADTDGDGVDDGTEVAFGTDPTEPDCNGLPLPLIPTVILLAGALLGAAVRRIQRE
ncbi:MAG: hypothetical protein NTZ09_14985, partial [Candidatus Hydrogenedentes bacterium]|nr:hypothetical protein [Candidatus Hydrogenedentota bacterium]